MSRSRPTEPEPVSRRGRAPKVALSRALIATTALETIRLHGAQNVKLTDIAAALDTGPASLYVYFANRDALLQHALDVAYQQVPLPDPEVGDWRSALTSAIDATIDVLSSYPGLGLVALGNAPLLPGAFRIAEVELRLLHRAGLDDAGAALALDLIAQFAAATALERAPATAVTPDQATVRAAYEAADPDRYPSVRRLARTLTAADDDTRRDFAVQVLLDGLLAHPHATASQS